MTSDPFFSIIIPTHNRAQLLSVAIQSVIDQSYENWELIIVDDGSTDDTKKILENVVQKNQRIKYYYQEHHERSVARNKGILHSNGQYLCFLDDDDYLLPDHLKTLFYEIQDKRKPIAIFRTGMIIKNEKKEDYSPLFKSGKDKNPILFFLKNMVGIHTLCFHHEILNRYQFDERWFHFQDTHLLIRCLLEYPFYQIDKYTTIYMRYPEMGSIQIFRSQQAKFRTENNVKAIKDLFDKHGQILYQYVPKHMELFLVSKKYLDHAGGALYVGRRRLAREYFKKSLQQYQVPRLLSGYLKFLIRYGFSFLFRSEYKKAPKAL